MECDKKFPDLWLSSVAYKIYCYTLLRFQFLLFAVSVYKALMINVKAQLMERDAIYVQSLLHF